MVTGGSGLYVDALCRGMDQLPKADPQVREALNEVFSKKGIQGLQHELQECDPDYYRIVDLQNPVRLIRALEVFRNTGKPYSQYLNQSKHRLPYPCLYIGLETSRELLYERINQRLDNMLKLGLLEEVKRLFEQYPENKLLNNTVGYQEFIPYIKGQCALELALDQAKKNSRNYAKRQWTWFRKNKEITWFNALDQSIKEKIFEHIDRLSEFF